MRCAKRKERGDIYMNYSSKEEPQRYRREIRQKRRAQWIADHGPCTKCGSWSKLQIDHIDPRTKTMSSSDIWHRRKEVRGKELSQCQVLCKSCHRLKSNAEVVKGDKHCRAKLSPLDRALIKYRYNTLHHRVKDIAHRYSVAPSTIYDLINGKTYK